MKYTKVNLPIVSLAICVLLMLSGTLFASQKNTTRQTANCRPGLHQAVVYSASGKCNVLGPGIYPTTAAAGLGNEPIVMIKNSGFVDSVVCGISAHYDLKCQKTIVRERNFRASDYPWTYVHVVDSSRTNYVDDLYCHPKDNEVTIGAQTFRYVGPCIRLTSGIYETAQKMHLGLTVKSAILSRRKEAVDKLRRAGTLLVKGQDYAIVAGAKMQAKVCERKEFKDCKYIHARGIVSAPVSMRVMKFCDPGEYQAGVFAEANGYGVCKLLTPGLYKTADSLYIEGKPPQSLRLGSHVRVRSCTKENLQGDCADATGKQILRRPSGIQSLDVYITQ